MAAASGEQSRNLERGFAMAMWHSLRNPLNGVAGDLAADLAVDVCCEMRHVYVVIQCYLLFTTNVYVVLQVTCAVWKRSCRVGMPT